MKRLITLISIFTLTTMIYAQCDVDGNYRVSALDVQYYDIARQTTNVDVVDPWGLGIALTLQTINAGDVFYGTHSGPYNEATLAAIGVNLNVNFNQDDCTASLAEGSYYPDAEEEDCVTSVQVLPIVDDMIFSSSQTMVSPTPATNLIGFPSISARAGENHGGLSLDQALIFDYFPQGWEGYGNQFGPDGEYMSGDEVAPVTLPTTVNNPETGEPLLPAGAHLPGVHGGWITVGDVGESQIPTSSGTPDGFAEWHAIDGPASESGLGDFIGSDEDGYDGDFDRTFGLPVIPTATYFSEGDFGGIPCDPLGAGSTPVAGDLTEVTFGLVADGCYQTVLASYTAGCYATVAATVAGGAAAECGAADVSIGGDGTSAFAAVFGTCVEGATDEAWMTSCMDPAIGMAGSVYGACMAAAEVLNHPDIGQAFCEAQGAGYLAEFGDDCAGALADIVSTDPADMGFCLVSTNTYIGDGMSCEDFGAAVADSYSDEELDALAAEALGASCTDAQAALAADYATGDPSPTTLGTLDGAAAAATGATCGQTADLWNASCISIDTATDVWVMDPTGASAAWGNFATWNAVAFSQCMEYCVPYAMENYGLPYEAAYGGCLEVGPYTCGALLADDSGSVMDGSCLADGDTSDCSGRIPFHFNPTCIPEIEVRQVVIEFTEVGTTCDQAGNANGDATVNILDVVGMVAAILGNGTVANVDCADFNGDGVLNILDVVATVQAILGNTRADYASNVTINKSADGATFDADGYVGGIQITLSHDEDFELKLTEDALVADYNTTGKETTLIVVAPEGSELFTTDDSFTITEAVSASADNYIDTGVNTAESYAISNAYPNPFNPSTSFNITLDTDANVSVKVYNVMGQLVSVLSEGSMTQGVHTFNWDASQLSSGAYFVNTQVGSEISTQKVMLVK